MTKQRWKTLFGYIKSIIIIVLAVGLIWTIVFKPMKEKNNVASIISLDQTPSDTIRDPKGQLHAQKEYIFISSSTIAEAMYKSQIDSLKKELALRPSAQINSMGTITTSTETTFKPEVKRDTGSTHITLSYTNKWADVSLSSDTSVVSRLRYKDSLIFATITEPYGFLNLKEKQYIDVKSANKDVKQIGVTFFEVRPPKNNRAKLGFGIGVGPGVALMPSTQEVQFSWITVNGGIQYRF